MSPFTAGNVGVSTLLANLGSAFASTPALTSNPPSDVKNIPGQATFAGLLASITPAQPAKAVGAEPPVPPLAPADWVKAISKGLQEGTLRLVRELSTQESDSGEVALSILATAGTQDEGQTQQTRQASQAGVPSQPLVPNENPSDLELDGIVLIATVVASREDEVDLPATPLPAPKSEPPAIPIETWTIEFAAFPAIPASEPLADAAKAPLPVESLLTQEPRPQPGTLIRIVIPPSVLEGLADQIGPLPSSNLGVSTDHSFASLDRSTPNLTPNVVLELGQGSFAVKEVAKSAPPVQPLPANTPVIPDLTARNLLQRLNLADSLPISTEPSGGKQGPVEVTAEAPVLLPSLLPAKKDSGIKFIQTDAATINQKPALPQIVPTTVSLESVEQLTVRAGENSSTPQVPAAIPANLSIRPHTTLLVPSPDRTGDSATPLIEGVSVSLEIKSVDTSSTLETAQVQGTPIEGESTVIEQVVRQVRSHGKPGESEIVVRLKPESLGEIRIRIVQTGKSIVAEVIAENRTTQDLLARHAEPIRLSLVEAGMKADQVVVKTGPMESGLTRPAAGAETSDRSSDPWRDAQQQSGSRRGRRDQQPQNAAQEDFAWRRWDLYA